METTLTEIKYSSKNAGEWAEFYTLIKVLSDGKLYNADGALNISSSEYSPIVSVEMQSRSIDGSPSEPITYIVDSTNHSIEVTTKSLNYQIPMSRFKEEASSFFDIICKRSGRSFTVPEITKFILELGNPETKQSSDKKADIHIVIHDTITGFNNEVGFSIKSKHSKPASLINPSGQTLFKYALIGVNSNNLQLVKDSLSPNVGGPKARIQKLLGSGVNMEFEAMKKDAFRENLQLIDSSLDVFLADCLLVFMSGSITSIKKIVEQVSLRNPCQFKASSQERLLDFYQYKMKRLILDAALGMQPRSKWTGEYDASGGYLIVKEDGDVVCYHLYNWNALQDYLFNNLRFETPSSTGKGSKSSFNYALYYTENNQNYTDICLQIRFK